MKQLEIINYKPHIRSWGTYYQGFIGSVNREDTWWSQNGLTSIRFPGVTSRMTYGSILYVHTLVGGLETYIGNNHPNSLIFFQRGWNHQPVLYVSWSSKDLFSNNWGHSSVPIWLNNGSIYPGRRGPHICMWHLWISKRRLGLEMFPTKWSCIKVFPDMNGD